MPDTHAADVVDTPNPDDRLIKLAEVCRMVGLSPASVWRLVKTPNFPRPVSIVVTGTSGTQTLTRWSANEVQAWVAARRSSRTQ